MRLRLNTLTIHRFILTLYLALLIVFQGASNTWELYLTVLLFIINIVMLMKNGSIKANIARIVAGCLFLVVWIIGSIAFGQSSGNVGPLYMQMVFFLTLINFISINEIYSNEEKPQIKKVIFILTAVGLIYNVYMYIIHPEYRSNLYIVTQNKGRFIGGVTYSMYIGFYSVYLLNKVISRIRNHEKKYIHLLLVCAIGIYYIVFCNPSATVIIVSTIFAIVTIVLSRVKHRGDSAKKAIVIIAAIIIVPVLLWFALNYAAAHIDSSSRLYDRFNAIIQVVESPSAVFSNTYFSRATMLIDEFALTFRSWRNFLVGTGYNFTSYSSVSQQMDLLGIGYHSSMIDWFPTYGFISGILLWTTFARIGKYIKVHSINETNKLLWTAFIIYCFLNNGFASILLVAVTLLPMCDIGDGKIEAILL